MQSLARNIKHKLSIQTNPTSNASLLDCDSTLKLGLELKVENMQELAKSINSFIIFFSEIDKLITFCWIIPPPALGTIKYLLINVGSDPDRILPSQEEPVNRLEQMRGLLLGGDRTFEIMKMEDERFNAVDNFNFQLKNLYKILWKYIVPWVPLPQARRLVIIPDSELYRVPFCSILEEQNQPLLLRHIISISPSIHSVLI